MDVIVSQEKPKTVTFANDDMVLHYGGRQRRKTTSAAAVAGLSSTLRHPGFSSAHLPSQSGGVFLHHRSPPVPVPLTTAAVNNLSSVPFHRTHISDSMIAASYPLLHPSLSRHHSYSHSHAYDSQATLMKSKWQQQETHTHTHTHTHTSIHDKHYCSFGMLDAA